MSGEQKPPLLAWAALVALVLGGVGSALPFPQPYHRYPLTAFYNEWLAFALGLGAAVSLLHARESRPRWRPRTPRNSPLC